MRTTYILGAGASHAAWGLPLMKDFFADQEDHPDGSGVNADSELREYVEERFGDFGKANLEDVLTDLDHTLNGLGSLWHGVRGDARMVAAQVLYGKVTRMIGDRLRIPRDGRDIENAQSAYRKILGGIGKHDYVITFNYDLGIETYATGLAKQTPAGKAIGDLRKATGELLCDTHPHGMLFGMQTTDYPSYLLKLHGSLDYWVCSNALCPVRVPISAPYPGGARDVLPDCCNVCGADIEKVIVPPSVTKSFERFPKLCLLWRLAERALRASQKIVVWGFSCPPSDHHVSWLLRACRETPARRSPLASVVVIDPCHEQVGRTLQGLLGRQEQARWRYFEDHEGYEDDGLEAGREGGTE